MSDRLFANHRSNRVLLSPRGQAVYRWGPVLLLLLVPSAVDWSAIGAFWQRLNEPFVRAEVGELAAYVKANAEPSDHLWVTHPRNSRFYIETGLTSPIDVHAFFPDWLTDSWRTTGEEKVAGLRSGLTDNQPAWLILTNNTGELLSVDLFYWVCDNYVRMPIIGEGYGIPAYLYVRNDRHEALPDAAEFPGDALCAGAYINLNLEHYQRSEWEAALAASQKAATLDALDPVAHNNICVAYIQLKDYRLAIASCEAGLAIDPQHVLLQNNLRWAQTSARQP